MTVLEAGREAWIAMDEEQRDAGLTAQDRGRAISMMMRVNRAKEKYSTPGSPAITPNNELWSCKGDCGGDCAAGVNILSFKFPRQICIFGGGGSTFKEGPDKFLHLPFIDIASLGSVSLRGFNGTSLAYAFTSIKRIHFIRYIDVFGY